MNVIVEIGRGLLNLVYPSLCEVCSGQLVKGERLVCLACLYRMPATGFWLHADNAVEQAFWGRQVVERACALFYFRKGSAYRPLLHKLKYEGRADIGLRLGEELGRRLMGSELYKGLDCIVPVPLHPIRERKRGYNQSERIAVGMAGVMGIPAVVGKLVRVAYTDTQTNKGRLDRWSNMANVFAVRDAVCLRGLHVLLVDDVITTGATLGSCVDALAGAGCRVSVAALAFASYD